ncbi:MAG: aminodeoxychorismate/anthranilate synthase component II [Bacteroidota bacterium]
MKILLIDNYDSFTHMLADYVRQCGVECFVIRNDHIDLKSDEFIKTFDAFILSPGPETPAKAGLMMDFITRHHQRKPMLGVCLGHQALGEFFGAELVKASLPRHGKVDEVRHHDHELFNHIPCNFRVTRYHSLILTGVKQPITTIASGLNEEVMALAHSGLPLFGIQFHPESCLTEHGLTIIKNYTEIVKQHLR